MFEKIAETLSSTGKAVTEKTKQGSDIVKANIKIANEERALTDIYTEMGKLYYDNHKDDPCCEAMSALCSRASEKIASVEALKAQVMALKGVNVCPNCGAEIPQENEFCGKCGAKIERPAPEKAANEEPVGHEDTVENTPDIEIKVDPNDKGGNE
ncbi:MAG: zinc-ribbon domain-containing protein [Ruminococcus sp.]|nr:zinc-ribbon domain-containing protein [Ruminococcus sp.]